MITFNSIITAAEHTFTPEAFTAPETVRALDSGTDR